MHKAIFVSVQDLALYKRLAEEAHERIKGNSFKFAGSTFGHMTHCGQCNPCMRPIPRLLCSWAHLAQMAENIVDDLQEFDGVFVHELGRECFHRAIEKSGYSKEVLIFHENLVKARVKAFGIRPPLYLSRYPTNPIFIEADKHYFENPDQRIRYLEGVTDNDVFFDAIRSIRRELRDHREWCRQKAKIAA